MSFTDWSLNLATNSTVGDFPQEERSGARKEGDRSIDFAPGLIAWLLTILLLLPLLSGVFKLAMSAAAVSTISINCWVWDRCGEAGVGRGLPIITTSVLGGAAFTAVRGGGWTAASTAGWWGGGAAWTAGRWMGEGAAASTAGWWGGGAARTASGWMGGGPAASTSGWWGGGVALTAGGWMGEDQQLLQHVVGEGGELDQLLL